VGSPPHGDGPPMKVALVHDWLTGIRGGERVLERMCARFPGAPIYTLVWKPGAVAGPIESHPIRTSFVQGLPEADRFYRWYLPLFPRAIETFDFTGFDAVVSSSHCVAKSVCVPPGTFHLSYLHTPMRYVYDLKDVYFPPGRFPWPVSAWVDRTLAGLRRWDIATSGRAHAMLCNSAHVADRIRRHYGREADVIHPPVDVARYGTAAPFAPASAPSDSGGAGTAHGAIGRPFYLLAGAFAPYKRTDLAIEACVKLGRRVLVVGMGQDERALRKLVQSGVEFVGWTSDSHLAELYRQAQALIFPGEEDFGIVPVEAMASGCPVIAYGRGGAVETVGRGADAHTLARVTAGGAARVPGGVLFGTQSVDGVIAGIVALEHEPFDRSGLPERAEPFGVERFDREFTAAFERHWRAWQDGRAAAGQADQRASVSASP